MLKKRELLFENLSPNSRRLLLRLIGSIHETIGTGCFYPEEFVERIDDYLRVAQAIPGPELRIFVAGWAPYSKRYFWGERLWDNDKNLAEILGDKEPCWVIVAEEQPDRQWELTLCDIRDFDKWFDAAQRSIPAKKDELLAVLENLGAGNRAAEQSERYGQILARRFPLEKPRIEMRDDGEPIMASLAPSQVAVEGMQEQTEV